jgi:hypothetical protein
MLIVSLKTKPYSPPSRFQAFWYLPLPPSPDTHYGIPGTCIFDFISTLTMQAVNGSLRLIANSSAVMSALAFSPPPNLGIAVRGNMEFTCAAGSTIEPITFSAVSQIRNLTVRIS